MILANLQAIAVDLLVVSQVAVSLLLIPVVILQRPRSAGLGTLSGGALKAVIGCRASGVLRTATGWTGVAFLVNSLLLAVLI